MTNPSRVSSDTAAGAPSSDRGKEWKILAGTFDALVRTVRAGGNESAIAERLLTSWRKYPDVVLTLSPGKLLVGDRPALGETVGDVPWLMPAFMSGLSSLRLRPEASVDDAISLAGQLAGLTMDEGSITAFHDWLSADGAEGFDLDLQTSFTELMESAEMKDGRGSDAALGLRSEGLLSLGMGSVAISAQDLDRASLREEFDTPLDLYTDQARAGGFDVSDEAAVALAISCDDPTAWLLAEVNAVLHQKALREIVSAGRLGRRILARLSAKTDEAMLRFLFSLAESDDEYKRATAATLQSEAVGLAIARALDADGAEIPKLLRALLARSPAGLGKGMIVGLLERAASEPEIFQLVRELVTSLGAGRFAEALGSVTLADDAAAALVRAIATDPDAPSIISSLLERASPVVGAKILIELPPATRRALRASVQTALASSNQRVTQPLVEALAGGNAEDAAILAESLSPDWTIRALGVAGAAILRHDLGRTYLVPIVRDGRAQPRLRFAALAALESDAALLSEAVRWRAGELVDPPDVRKKLRETRARMSK